MPGPDEIQQQQELLATHRLTLTHLLNQAAQYGGEVFAPPQTANGIALARANIWSIKQVLRDWHVRVDDLPNEVETAQIVQAYQSFLAWGARQQAQQAALADKELN